jgi:hypothetical protein
MFDYLTAVCDSCGHTVKVTVEHGGRRAKCPKCEGIIEIPRKGDTSVRLRSDRELNQEARAKMGRGPDSDPEHPVVRAGGRGTARMRRPAEKPRKARRAALIVTLIATAAVVAGIIVVLLKDSGETPAAPPAAPIRKPAPPPPRPPPAPPVDPRAQDKESLRDRVMQYVRILNEKNDLTEIARFYTADMDKIRKAFGILGFDDKLTYEDVQVKTIEFPAGEDAAVSIAFTRVLTSGGKETKDEAVRVFKLAKVDGKWMITSPPEP